MPSNWLYVDSNFPSFSDDQSTDEKLDSVQNYLYMLVEQLRYQLFNLDGSNMNEQAKLDFETEIEDKIEFAVEGATGEGSKLYMDMDRIKLSVTGLEGDYSSLLLMANGLQTRVTGLEGNYSTLTQTAEGLQTKVSGLEGNYSTLTQTVNGISSEVYDGSGNSKIAQTASTLSAVVTGSGSSAQLNMAKSGIQLGVTNNEKSATITLTGNGISMQSKTIQFTGSVLFASDLGAGGTTVIDGGRIQTGTIDASLVNLKGLQQVYRNNTTLGGYIGAAASMIDGTAGIGVISANTLAGMIATDNGASLKYYVDQGSGYSPRYFTNEVAVTSAQAYMLGGTRQSSTMRIACMDNIIYLTATNSGNTRRVAVTNTGTVRPDILTSTADHYNLGTGTYRWYTVCGKNSSFDTSATTWSDRNAKQNITYDMAQYAAFYDALRPTPFMYKDNQSGRTHTGFISQDVEQALLDNGLTSTDFGGFVIERIEEGEPERYALRYEEFIALNTWQIQKLKARVAELERRMA